MTKCCFFLKTCCLCRRKSRIFTTLKKPPPPSPCNCVTLIPVCWVSLKFHLKCLFLPSETRRYLTMFHCNHQHWPWDPGPHMLLQWGVNWLNNNQLFLFNTNHAVNEELFHLVQLWTRIWCLQSYSQLTWFIVVKLHVWCCLVAGVVAGVVAVVAGVVGAGGVGPDEGAGRGQWRRTSLCLRNWLLVWNKTCIMMMIRWWHPSLERTILLRSEIRCWPGWAEQIR